MTRHGEQRDAIAREVFVGLAVSTGVERSKPWSKASGDTATSRREGERTWAQVFAEWSYVYADAFIAEQKEQAKAGRPPLQVR
jgi:hypothetical protein